MQCPYVGLTNQGATCYMNSYLQFLYMTKEFRSFLFSLHCRPDKAAKEKDSIPYQLQKLFAKLNIRKNKQISTKELTKAFQWQTEDNFTEHDVSEFGKLLFEAVRLSLNGDKLKDFEEVAQMFEGVSQQSLKCLNCNSQTSKAEKFSELNLIISNLFENLNFKKLENSLLQNIKPFYLEDDNKYFCERCDAKQDAEKIHEYTRFPEILMINLSRFTFDMMTFDRKKINNYFEFPLSIDFEEFVGSHKSVEDKIKHLLGESDSIADGKSKATNERRALNSVAPLTSGKGKKFQNVKTSSQTRDFLRQMKIKKKDFQAEIVPEIEIRAKEPHCDAIVSEEVPDVIIAEKPIENQTMPTNIKARIDGQPRRKSSRSLAVGELANGEVFCHDHNGEPKFEIPVSDKHINISSNCDSSLNFEMNSISKSAHVEESRLANDDVQNGYFLYAVFIHKGSAHAGHYYIYIKSFENGLWYLFDDYLVREVNIADVLKDGYGGSGSDICAYLLVYKKRTCENQTDTRKNRTAAETYRKEEAINGELHIKKLSKAESLHTEINGKEDIGSNIFKNLREVADASNRDDPKQQLVIGMSPTDCPAYLLEIIEAEMKVEEEASKANFKTMSLRLTAKHKIFYKLECKLIEVPIQRSFKDFFEDACSAFGIAPEERVNVRLRLYNKIKDEMQEIFDSEDQKNLKELKLNIAKNFIFEIKDQDKEWSAYDPNQIALKYVIWTEEARLADWEPQAQTIEISKSTTIEDFSQVLNRLYGKEPKAPINLVLKKTLKNGMVKGESLLADEKTKTKMLTELYLNSNVTIYVDFEAQSEWEKFFEAENNMIILNFNLPVEETQLSDEPAYVYKVKVDLNTSLQEFKGMIRKQVGIPDDKDFIIKKGGKLGIELKDFSKNIRSIGLINNSFLFLVYGKSIAVNEIKANVYICKSILNRDVFDLNRDIEFLGEFVINPTFTPAKTLEGLTDRLPNLVDVLFYNQSANNFLDYVGLDGNGNSVIYPCHQIDHQNCFPLKNSSPIKKDSAHEISIETKTPASITLDESNRHLISSLSNRQILSENHTRIREKNGPILTKLYKNASLKSQGMVDRKKIVIEPFCKPLEKDQIAIYFTKLDAMTLFLGPVKEIIINKQNNLQEIISLAIENGLNLELEDATATKIRDVRNFVVEDLITHRFFDMSKTNKVVSSAPFYLETDGCLFMLGN
jgi:ubiquitin C-terminal hydrolase